MSINRPKTDMAGRLRQRLREPGILVLPGAFNAATAKLIQANGFEGVYVTGAGLINGITGYPDIALMSATELIEAAAHIANAVDVPVICDADTGYGEALQVMRTVQLFERAGIAGIHLEDQVSPKRCGHLDGKQVLPIDQMVAKIRAACKARQNSDFMIIARVDSRAIHGMEDAIARAQAYVDAGADAIFPEAMENKDDFARMAQALPGVSLLANMTEFGKSPYLTAAEFEALGYRMVIFPMTLFRVMMKAADEALRALKATGTQQGFVDRMQTRQELYELIDYTAYTAMDRDCLPPDAGHSGNC